MDNVPALDDIDLRKKQAERFVGGIEQVGEYFKETKRMQKFSLWFTIIWLIVLVLLIGGSIVYAFMHGGIESVYDKDTIIRRFNCSGDEFHDTVRSYEDAEMFIKMYGGSCDLYHTG